MRPVESHVEAVTVYRSGARVTRTAELRVGEEGVPGQVRFHGLPLCLEDGSVSSRVEVLEGSGGLVPLGHRVEIDLGTPAEPVVGAADVLEELLAEEHRLGVRLEHLRADVDLVSRVLQIPAHSQAGREEPSAPFCLEAHRELVRLSQSQLRGLLGRSRALEEELDGLHARKAALRRRQEDARPRGDELKKAVVVTLRPEGAVARFRVQLSYQVPGVRWAPAYTFRFDRDLTMVDLSMRVALCQRTGEDWTGVNLEVSTSEPTAWRELPELASRRIGRAQPRPPKPGWRPPPLGTWELYADYDGGPSGTAKPEEFRGLPRAGKAPVEEPERLQELADLAVELSQASPGVADDLFGAAPCPSLQAEAGWAEPEAPAPRSKGTIQVDLLATRSRSGLRAGLLRSDVGAGATTLGGGKPTLGAGRPLGEKPGMVRRAAPTPTPPPARSRTQPGPPSQEPWGSDLTVGAEHLAYDLLRMPAPTEPGRGKLRVQDAVEACLRLWESRGEAAPLDPRQAVRAALSQCQQVQRVPLPSGHRDPRSVQGFDYLYPGEVPVDVPSDGRFHSLPLLTHELPARRHLVCVPRVSNVVFRQVEVDSLPDLSLPAGPVDVLVGGDYLLTTTLEDVVPGGSTRLGLGVEQAVKVARNVQFSESASGMMGGTLNLLHAIRVEVANRGAREATLEVRERIPTPAEGQKEVRVLLDRVEPEWEPIPEGAPGHHRWRVRLSEGEVRTLEASYRVEMPARCELAGGNRREA